MDTQDTPLGLRDYGRILYRHLPVIVGFVAFSALAAALFTIQQTETYTASSTVVLRTLENDQLFPTVTLTNRGIVRDIVAETGFAASDDFRAAADDAAGVVFPVRVIPLDETGELVFEVESTNPERSAEIADAWATTYVTQRSSVDATDTVLLLEKLTEERDARQAEMDVLMQPIRDLSEQLQSLPSGSTRNNVTNELTDARFQAKPEQDRISTEIRRISNDMAELVILRTNLNIPNLTSRVSQAAVVPTEPNDNGLARNLLLATFGAALLGVGFALTRESARDRILTSDELRDLTGLPVLSSLPKVKPALLGAGVERHARPPFLTEALQRLVSATLYTCQKQRLRSILVTSAIADEGKSTVATNLAVHIGRQGHRVLLIGADMRRPSLERDLGYQSKTGLAEYLEASEGLSEVMVPVVELDNLTLLPPGTPTRNPAELLRSEAFSNLVNSALTDYDYVIIDAPPVLPVIDAVEIGQSVDAAILVARVNTASESQLTQAIELVGSGGAEIIGTVLNASKPRDLGIDNYYDSSTEGERRERMRSARLERTRAREEIRSEVAAETTTLDSAVESAVESAVDGAVESAVDGAVESAADGNGDVRPFDFDAPSADEEADAQATIDLAEESLTATGKRRLGWRKSKT